MGMEMRVLALGPQEAAGDGSRRGGGAKGGGLSGRDQQGRGERGARGMWYTGERGGPNGRALEKSGGEGATRDRPWQSSIKSGGAGGRGFRAGEAEQQLQHALSLSMSLSVFIDSCIL